MKIGDLVRYRFPSVDTGNIGIIVKSRHHVIKPLTLLYIEWVNNEDNGWISAMNLEVIA